MLAFARNLSLTVAVLALLCSPWAAQELLAADLIFPGIQPKVSAGAGETVSRGSSALFYNPANLIFTKFIEPYVDVSFAQVTYTYQHTYTDEYDPVVVGVTAPPVTAGIGFRPVPSFALGAAIVPTGTGAVQLVENVPLEVSDGTIAPMNITTKNSGQKIAAGAAFRIGFPFTLGAGVINTAEKTQMVLAPPDAESEEEVFLDSLYQGSANQFTVGMRSEIVDRGFVAALRYTTAATMNYTGNFLLNIGDDADYTDFEGVKYLPAVIGLGLESRFGDFGLFFDYTRDMWSAGRTVAKAGYGTDKDEIDYLDTNNIKAGAKFWMLPKHMIEGAFGMYSANIGDGTPTRELEEDESELTQDEEEEAEPVIDGVQFGNLEAIPRTIFSGGYRYKLSGTGYFQMGAHYQKGSREIPEGYKQNGLFTLTVLLISGGIAFGF